MKELIRTVRFSPYRKDIKTTFTLKLYDTGTTDHYGKNKLAYLLTMNNKGDKVKLFEGSDYCCSPCYAIDSDESVAGLMAFLTLRPGDTDSDYFKDYTSMQLGYCNEHADALSCEVMDRFGEV